MNEGMCTLESIIHLLCMETVLALVQKKLENKFVHRFYKIRQERVLWQFW